MSLTPRLTLIGLYKYNNSLFSNLVFPDNIDKDIFIDSLLLEYGECPLIYPDLDFMLLAIGAWSRKWYNNFERIADAITAEYNPIYNYDRHEEWSETDALMRSETDAVTGNETNAKNANETNARMGNAGEDTEYTRNVDTNYAGDSTTENQVSAYNESEYQPKDKEIYNFNNDTDTDESYDSSTTRNTSENHTMNRTDNHTMNRTENRTTNSTENTTNGKTGHLYGNIGVTESTTMVQHELDLRKTENLYHIICELFYKEFCIYVF